MDEELAYLVLSVVEEIPAGRVATYGQLARLIGRERNARLVARVLSHAQEYGSFPCHRVVDHSGRIAPGWPEQARLLNLVNEQYDLKLDIPEKLKLFQLSEQHRRLVVINVSGLRRSGGSLLPSYTEEEFAEATFSFVKYYVQSEHYDELKERVKKLEFELEQELAWRNRTDEEQV